MNARTQLFCVWCGPVFLVLWLFGLWGLAGFVPPPPATAGPLELATLFQANTTQIRVGIFLTIIASALMGPFTALITVHLKRIEGRHAPLSYAQLVFGAVLVILLIFPMTFLETAAFRLDRSPDEILLLSDMTWMPFVGVYSTVMINWLVTGVVILSDERKKPIFPRWSGYVNLWLALLSLGGSFIYYWKSGPFSWTGVFAWWIPLGLFCVWIVVMSIVLLAAIKQQLLDEREPAVPIGAHQG